LHVQLYVGTPKQNKIGELPKKAPVAPETTLRELL
jgi:hypothetical protein